MSKTPLRQATVERNTKETRIRGTVGLDGTGAYDRHGDRHD